MRKFVTFKTRQNSESIVLVDPTKVVAIGAVQGEQRCCVFLSDLNDSGFLVAHTLEEVKRKLDICSQE